MEPASVPTATEAKARGSLNDPEVIGNVPGHVIPILEREFDDFDTESGTFLDGKIEETEFIKFRLKQGVYGQRQAAVQMIRVKLPFGGVTPDQLDAFAAGIERWVPKRKGHVTTRQNIQMHHVPLPDAAKLIRELGDAGLSSREGCGNTVRNVTGDPYAGIAADELFDCTPWAGAYVRYFVRHPITQGMPRKIKTSFDGSPEDRAISGIHDIAFHARVKDGVQGFEIRIGGGTSIMPRIAPTLWEFASAEDGEYLKIAEAVFRIFDAQDWLRVNRARARVKVLVDRDGIDAVRAMVEEELQGDWVSERDFTPHLFIHDEEANAPAKPVQSASPNGDSRAYDRWVSSNVVPQKQDGFSAATIKITRGDLTPDQFRGIAQIMRDFTGGYARTTVQQNIVLRWVRNEALYDVYRRLQALDLHEEGALEITDVVSCPGTDSCKLGITASMGLNRAIQDKVTEMQIEDPQTKRVHIKMSGCPNGCSQHHIADIGFYGASIKVGGKTMPAYVAHVGGKYEEGEVVYGTRLKVRLPAKRVPAAVERWLRMYEAERAEASETFRDYATRVGTKHLEDAVRELSLPVEFSLESMNEFIDWQRDVPFEVIRGEGECAV